jgi:CBS domain-containing protein
MRTAMYVSPLIEALEIACCRSWSCLNSAGNGLLGVIGIKREQNEAERYHTSEELQLIIEESHERGLLRGESGRILRELFEFGNLTAGEVMVPRVPAGGHPAGTPSATRRRSSADRRTRAIRSTRRPRSHRRERPHQDAAAPHRGGHARDTGDARRLPHVPTTTPLDEVLATMRRARAHMAVVMDEHGGTAGVVTIGDLFEEVVGDIDEDRGRPPISRDALGRVVVRGTVRLTSAGDALGVTLEHPDVQSVSGLRARACSTAPRSSADVVTWGQVAHLRSPPFAGRGSGRRWAADDQLAITGTMSSTDLSSSRKSDDPVQGRLIGRSARALPSPKRTFHFRHQIPAVRREDQLSSATGSPSSATRLRA